MFFGVAEKLLSIATDKDINCIILRMRSVPAMDATGMNALVKLFHKCKKDKVTLLLSHVNEQPMKAMKKAGFVEMVGEENFLPNIDAALVRADQIVK